MFWTLSIFWVYYKNILSESGKVCVVSNRITWTMFKNLFKFTTPKESFLSNSLPKMCIVQHNNCICSTVVSASVTNLFG